MGSIEAGSISDLGATALMPEIAFSDFPGMYRDMDEVKEKFFNGWVGEEIKKIGEKYGVHVLGYTDNAFRWISNSKRPIEKIEDLKGLKIRVPETDFLVKFFERFDALPAAVPFGELPAALQQGTVDGQENGPISIWPYGLYEYNKYLTQTNHSYCSHISMVNQGVWDSLSAKQQKDLQDAFDYAAPLQWDAMAAHIQSCIDNLDKEEGVEIVWLDDEMYQALVEAGKETASSDYYVDMFGQDIVDKMYQ
jgi:TRAP-type C4-dicarboxylate transport system substrate-binding protein